MMKSNIKCIVGENIRKYRKKLGLSQEDLADKARLHRTYIGGVERGERNITLDSMQQIANALGIKVADLFVEENNV